MTTPYPKKHRVKPNPNTEHLFDPATGKMVPVMCKQTTTIQLDACVHNLQCNVPDDPHPGMPHTAEVESTEWATDTVFVWWDVDVTDENHEDTP
jgi:hypothetical protein